MCRRESDVTELRNGSEVTENIGRQGERGVKSKEEEFLRMLESRRGMGSCRVRSVREFHLN